MPVSLSVSEAYRVNSAIHLTEVATTFVQWQVITSINMNHSHVYHSYIHMSTKPGIGNRSSHFVTSFLNSII